jgi:DNA-binding MarR family transcriptional regulator
LTEQGLNLALMRSGQPIAAEFRTWLASEVVPEIARTGRYDPSASEVAPEVARVGGYDPLARLRTVRPSQDTLALIRIVGAAIAVGRLDIAADLIDAGRRLAAAPGERLLPPSARLRASNRLLVRLIHRRALKGPRLAQLLQQTAWRPSEKAVLGLLLDLGGEELRVQLSVRDLAERIDVSRRTVIAAIRVLKKAGVVTCTRGARGGRDPQPNVYVVNAEALAEWNGRERPETWSGAERGQACR